jgi:hypothetical protein
MSVNHDALFGLHFMAAGVEEFCHLTIYGLFDLYSRPYDFSTTTSCNNPNLCKDYIKVCQARSGLNYEEKQYLAKL